MVLVGVAVFAAYLVAGYVVYEGLVVVWNARPGAAATVGAVLCYALCVAAFSHAFGTARVLSNLGAVDLPPSRAPTANAVVDRLAARMRVSRPRLLVADLEAPNAFALGGPRRGAVVVDRTLFSLLSVREFRALLAHELAHLESNDTLVQTVGVTVGRTAVSLLLVPLLPVVLVVTGVARGTAWLGGRPEEWQRTPAGRLRVAVVALLTVLLFGSTILVRSHSRRRELAADDRAVGVTGDPLALASALRTLQRAADPRLGLFSPLYVAPREDDLTRLLSTHPPLSERIDRLVARVDEPPATTWRRVELR